MRKRFVVMKGIVVCAALALLAAGPAWSEDINYEEAFGGGEKTPAASGQASAGQGVISGKIVLEGAPAAPPAIKMEADPYCEMQHPDPATPEEIVANPNGTLKNVFIYLKEGVQGQAGSAPKEPVKFDQKNCWYDPHVFGLRVGQPLEIWNSDDTLHNVHAYPEKSSPFNVGMPIKGMKLQKTFSAPEVMVKIKCDVHPWMQAYVGVLDHPFFSVSGADGAFEIKDIPAGTYTVEAWHEKLGVQSQQVSLAASETKALDFTFQAA